MNQPVQPPPGYPPPGYPPPGYPPPGYPPPPKRSAAKTALIALAVLAGVCLVTMMGSKGGRSSSGGASSGGASPTGQSTDTAGSAGSAGEEVATAVALNTPFVVAGLEAVVQSARFAQTVSRNAFSQHTAHEGATLVIMTYRVRNTTNEPIQALSFADAVVINGATFQPSMECNMAVNTLGVTDTLNPNLPRTFEACFEVPTGSRGVVAKFNRSLTTRYAQTGL